MKTFVEFRSDKFPALPGEEEQINPGIWGKRLAYFLREGLRGEGIETGEAICEDWGWIVPVVNPEFDLWIGCGNQGNGEEFLCFIEPSKPYIRKFFIKKIETAPRINALQAAMEKVLEKEPAIRDIRWRTEEEFKNPAAS